jgi:hypothetical protein
VHLGYDIRCTGFRKIGINADSLKQVQKQVLALPQGAVVHVIPDNHCFPLVGQLYDDPELLVRVAG